MIEAFARERAARHDPPDGLVARIMDDARRLQRSPAPVEPLWRQILRALGGWPAAAGLAATAGIGLWIGVEVPAAMLEAGDNQIVLIESDLGSFDHLLLDG
ncbi:hypothetical protein [Marivita sp. GX14005]|uniref:hypothetical protein n=1 Tax=Marivita sp. GX14005 TaxID=2942276 RepID=UPI0020184532|nr:hypothetical protein [Marivita sp. GX14005]MCL3882160.1 hypothetical protein [Marivita sp. GX14005]